MDIRQLAAGYFSVPLGVIDPQTEIDILCILKCARNIYPSYIDQLHVALSMFRWKDLQPSGSGTIMCFKLNDVFVANDLPVAGDCIYCDQRAHGGFYEWQMEHMGFAIELHEHYYKDKMSFYNLWFCLIGLNDQKDAPVLADLLKLEKFQSNDIPEPFKIHDN